MNIKREYYPNGQLRYETPQENGRVHGISKSWHSNGVISSEVPFENGLQHGKAKFWTADERFLGEYLMDHGTGIIRMWYNNGQLRGELPYLNGLLAGRQRSWDEVGEPAATLYWLRGKKVSKKKYYEICKTDSELPQYPT